MMTGVRATEAQRPSEVLATTVVVVKNLNNADSVALADCYAGKRGLPAENICPVRMTDVAECSYQECSEQLMGPLKQFLARLNRPIDCIVLTKGIPIRIHEGSGDGPLARRCGSCTVMHLWLQFLRLHSALPCWAGAS
jgi:uncharacterized protein (TIGR03790 family)